MALEANARETESLSGVVHQVASGGVANSLPVAQLDRARGCGPRGRRFEPCQVGQSPTSAGHPPHRARVAKEIRRLAAIGPGWKCRRLSEEAFRVLADAATSLGVASKGEWVLTHDFDGDVFSEAIEAAEALWL